MKRMAKQLLVPLLLVILTHTLSACTQTDNHNDQSRPYTATVTVTGYDNMIVLSQTEAGFSEGETVLDVLLRVSEDNDIVVDYTGFGDTAYVKGINNLYEFDYGGESGWVYIVSGTKEMPNVSCGAYRLKDGDDISWVYVTEYAA